MWYRRIEQTNRNAAWYAMLGVVNIVWAQVLPWLRVLMIHA